MVHISDIKLIRTDTTLDLSQKAEKVMSWKRGHPLLFIALPCCISCSLGEVGLNNQALLSVVQDVVIELTGLWFQQEGWASKFKHLTPP